MPPATDLQHTPLYPLHLALGARMISFAGYAMPVQYPQGLLAEHRQTREHASLFDVSHMGQISVSGPNAAQCLERVLPINAIDLPVHKQTYALLLNEQGGILDDLMVINRGSDYLLIVNAANKHQDLAWLQTQIGQHCQIQALPDRALLALQGPQASTVLQQLWPSTGALLFMHGAPINTKTTSAYVTRSGYTGEDGFEISISAQDAESFARRLLQHPEVQPAGLGARNSLRLEAGLCLHGNDINAQTTPVEAGLSWSIPQIRRSQGARAGQFTGAETVLAQLNGSLPVQRVRVGLHGLERIPVRDGAPLLLQDGTAIGQVTSGLLSPSLDRSIAMAYIPPTYAAAGARLNARVREHLVPMEVVPMPFIGARYRKS